MDKGEKRIIQQSYNKQSRLKVLKSGIGSTTLGKFVAIREGPYKIYDITLGGSYKIEGNKKPEDLSWNYQ